MKTLYLIKAILGSWTLHPLDGVYQYTKTSEGNLVQNRSVVPFLVMVTKDISDFRKLISNPSEYDSIYNEYKLKHAHLGMKMSFEQYVSETELHGNLTQIK